MEVRMGERENDDDCSMTRLDLENFEFEHFKLDFIVFSWGGGRSRLNPIVFRLNLLSYFNFVLL